MHVGVNLLVLTRRPPGGTGYHAVSLFEALVEAAERGDADVRITGFVGRDAIGYLSARAQRYAHVLPAGGAGHRVRNELVGLPRAARRVSVDVIVNPAFLGAPWSGPKRALIIHDLYFRSDPGLVPWRRRLMLRLIVPVIGAASDPILAVSNATRNQLRRYYPKLGRRAQILPSGVRSLGMGDDESVSVQRPFLLMVGHLTANKSPETAVAAVAALREEGRDLMLVHIGDDGGRLGPSARAAGIDGDVVSLGRQPDGVLAACYRRCAALVIPSIREGFGLPLIEAQAQGAPVIASTCDALVEVAGGAALFFPVDDRIACAEAVRRVLDDPSMRDDLVARGRINAASFRWDRTAALLLAALRSSGGQPAD